LAEGVSANIALLDYASFWPKQAWSRVEIVGAECAPARLA